MQGTKCLYCHHPRQRSPCPNPSRLQLQQGRGCGGTGGQQAVAALQVLQHLKELAQPRGHWCTCGGDQRAVILDLPENTQEHAPNRASLMGMGSWGFLLLFPQVSPSSLPSPQTWGLFWGSSIFTNSQYFSLGRRVQGRQSLCGAGDTQGVVLPCCPHHEGLT